MCNATHSRLVTMGMLQSVRSQTSSAALAQRHGSSPTRTSERDARSEGLDDDLASAHHQSVRSSSTARREAAGTWGATVTRVVWMLLIGAALLIGGMAGPSLPMAGLESTRADAIERVSAHQYVVYRTAISTDAPEPDLRTTRVMLHQGPSGEYNGYRFSSLNTNSLPAQLGIQDGDVLHAINGQDVVSYETAMVAYHDLLSADHATLLITRNHEPLTLSYQIL